MLRSTAAYRAFRNRNYAIFAGFGWLSTMGFWMFRVALQWVVWDLTESYVWLGLVAILDAVAFLLVTPWAGALADRMDRKRLGQITRLATCVASLVLGLLLVTDQLSLWALVLIVIATGVADGFWTPTRLAIVPNLVPRSDLPAAMGMSAVLFNLSQVFGPALAGVVIIAQGAGAAFLFSAVAAGVFAVALSGITVNQSFAPGRERSGVWSAFRDGIDHAMASERIRIILILNVAVSLLARPYRDLLPGYVDQVMGLGAQGLAGLASAVGAGAIAASYTAASLHQERSRVLGGAGILIAVPVFLAGLGLGPSFNGALVLCAGLGFCMTYLAITSQILIQDVLDDHARGRVMSLWGAQIRVLPAIGTLAIGGLASFSSITSALLAAALVTVAALIWLGPSLLRLMRRVADGDQTG